MKSSTRVTCCLKRKPISKLKQYKPFTRITETKDQLQTISKLKQGDHKEIQIINQKTEQSEIVLSNESSDNLSLTPKSENSFTSFQFKLDENQFKEYEEDVNVLKQIEERYRPRKYNVELKPPLP